MVGWQRWGLGWGGRPRRAAKDRVRGVLLDPGSVAGNERIHARIVTISAWRVAPAPRDDADLDEHRPGVDEQGASAVAVARIFVVDTVMAGAKIGIDD